MTGLQVQGMFLRTPQADNSKVVRAACHKIFKKNTALKVQSLKISTLIFVAHFVF